MEEVGIVVFLAKVNYILAGQENRCMFLAARASQLTTLKSGLVQWIGRRFRTDKRRYF